MDELINIANTNDVTNMDDQDNKVVKTIEITAKITNEIISQYETQIAILLNEYYKLLKFVENILPQIESIDSIISSLESLLNNTKEKLQSIFDTQQEQEISAVKDEEQLIKELIEQDEKLKVLFK